VVDVVHVAREVAETHTTLTAPARVIAMRAQGEAEIAKEQGITAYDGKTGASARQIATNQMIPLPDPARRGLVNLTNHLIAACNRAVAAAAPLAPSESAQPKRSGAPPALRRSGQSRMAPRRNPRRKDPEDEPKSFAEIRRPRAAGTRSQVVHGCSSREPFGIRRNQGSNVDHLRRSPIAEGWALEASAAGVG
jgi:hypothetical protein